MKTSKKVGFVGVGRMGANMARRLVDQGYRVTAVYDVNRELAAALGLEVGCLAVSTLAEVTANADVILTVVPDDEAMRQIFGAGEDSLLRGSPEGRTFINCATVTPQVHREVEALCAAKGAVSLEACMASSITQAREGTLYLMIGGAEAVFEQVKPILVTLSSSMRYIGTAGRAAEVKALVNMVMNINTAGLAEGLALGDALGIDLTMLREVFAETGAGSRVLQTDGEDMQNREHDCYFSGAHAAKDSGIAAGLGVEHGLHLPLNDATCAQYERMVERGIGELDKSGIAELTFKNRR